ncbi:hypothetical protein D3C80_1315010 [compost metagenome]
MSYGRSVKLLIFVTTPVLIWVSQQPLAIATLLKALQIQAFVTTLLVLTPLSLRAVLKADIQPLTRETLLAPTLVLVAVAVMAMVMAPAAMAAMAATVGTAGTVVVLASLVAPILTVSLISIVQAT